MSIYRANTPETEAPHVFSTLVFHLSTDASSGAQTSTQVPLEKKSSLEVIHLCHCTITVAYTDDQLYNVGDKATEDDVEMIKISAFWPNTADKQNSKPKLQRLSNSKGQGISR